MPESALATCPLCEANCGLLVTHDGERLLGVRGDPDDPLSRGYLCPKATALQDLQSDPDRLREPMRRVGDRWYALGWDEAIEEAAERIASIQREHGRSAVALYVGNPTVHSWTAVLYGQLFHRAVHTRSVFSSNSVDALPRLLVSYWLYGSQAVIPVPDVDRTQFLLVLGANPLVSNGSVMTAPDFRRRLKALRARGGRLVVVDPRRSETAEYADEHLFVRPGADALLLAALVRVVLDEKLAVRAPTPGVTGLERLRELLSDFSPEAVAGATGISAEKIRELARAFARADSAACYGRMGTSTQEHGTVASWLVDVLNIVTGNLDRPGGSMFPTPAVDLAALAARVGQTGHHGVWRSRVRGLPESNGELPAVTLAEEIDTPGDGRIRGLVTFAGNPVLSVPNGRRLEKALGSLDFMVSIDIYRNETTRHADLILPTTFGLEHGHYPLVFGALSVRNTAKLTHPVLPRPEGLLHDWELLSRLSARLWAKKGRRATRLVAPLAERLLGKLPPERVLDLLLRAGPHRLSLRKLERSPHGIDLGPLEPRLAELTEGRPIPIAPEPIVSDLERLRTRLRAAVPELVLIGRRQLRSNNSWMHNSARLVTGTNRCTLMMHPDDARGRGIASGDAVRLSSRVGSIEVAAELTDEVARGVVSLPHGWGHDRQGVDLSVAKTTVGASVNDVTDERFVDELSGCAALSGVEVRVEALK